MEHWSLIWKTLHIAWTKAYETLQEICGTASTSYHHNICQDFILVTMK